MRNRPAPDISTSIELSKQRKYIYTCSIDNKEQPHWQIAVSNFDETQPGMCIDRITRRHTAMRLSDWIDALADEVATRTHGNYTDLQYESCRKDLEHRYTKLLLHIALHVRQATPSQRNHQRGSRGKGRAARRAAAAIARRACKSNSRPAA